MMGRQLVGLSGHWLVDWMEAQLVQMMGGKKVELLALQMVVKSDMNLVLRWADYLE